MKDKNPGNSNVARCRTCSQSEPAFRSRRGFILVASAIMISGCVNFPLGRLDPLRQEVDELVRGLELGLRRGGWMSVERYFSDDYHSTLTDIRERLDDRRRKEFAADWRLQVSRILTQDKRVIASVRWSHRWNDLKGKPQKRNGDSELILRHEQGELRILDIRGGMI
jgi:hypothetical protein